jgi:hypothetical protein
MRRQIDRMHAGKPAPALAPGGANGFDDIGLGHDNLRIGLLLTYVKFRAGQAFAHRLAKPCAYPEEFSELECCRKPI